jgi:Tol biopolymer transport system component
VRPIPTDRIAFVGADDNNLYLIETFGQPPKRLTADGPFMFGWSWSPDGQYVVFMSFNNKLEMMKYDGSERRVLVENASAVAHQAAWSPDGSKIAFQKSVLSGGGGVFIISADGSGLRQLTRDNGRPHSWTADGQHIRYEASAGKGPGFYQVGLGGAEPEALIQPVDGGHLNAVEAAWSPDGRHVVLKQSQTGAVLATAEGTASRRFDLYTSFSNPVWAPTSEQLVFNRTGTLYLVDKHGRDERKLSSDVVMYGSASWSSDGSYLLYVESNAGAGEGPYATIISADGTNRVRVTNESAIWVTWLRK